jgi:ATP/maltotriose-dependent transcriptional regulator MalT
MLELQKLRPVLAGRLAEHALQSARQNLDHDSSAIQLPAALLAESLYEQGRLEEADNLLRFRIAAIRASGSLECAARAYGVLARISMHSGQREFALSSLRDARSLGQRRCWPRLVAVSAAECSQILLEDGDLDAAADSMRELAALIEESTAVPTVVQRAMRMQLWVLELRLAISRDGADAAAADLTRLYTEQTRANCDARWTLQLQLQLAALHARYNRETRARDILTKALKVGAGNGLCMSFMDAGPCVRELIAALCREPPVGDSEILDLLPYSRNLLRQFNRAAMASGARRVAHEVNQALTRRESGILQLIANGLSNKRIAQHLDITPETVKSHAKNIFFKLAAQTRAQAVARAEALGII